VLYTKGCHKTVLEVVFHVLEAMEGAILEVVEGVLFLIEAVDIVL
jgi:hypothetical protein